MKPHRNLPFFVPHAGCPNCCVFCSQVKITGQRAEKDINTELFELTEMLESAEVGGSESQIGFFGGSFTAIERPRMVALLEKANEYIKRGVAKSIRVSTRPDKINSEVLALLKEYNVTNIELGIQSTSDFVLKQCERGHTAAQSLTGARMVVESGFELCGQMMVGLPGADLESELKTARDIVKMGATEARIYPTVVFAGTKLFDMAKNGDYIPLTLEDAVDRTAKCFKVFLDAGVKLLRIGLHSSESLLSAPMGANHPAIGELVKSRVYTDLIIEQAGDCKGKVLCVEIKKEDISKLSGHNNSAINRLKEHTGALAVEVIPSNLPEFMPLVKIRSV